MRPTYPLAGLTALALGVLASAWLLSRAPDRGEVTVRVGTSGSPIPTDDHSGSLLVDAEVGTHVGPSSIGRLTVEAGEPELGSADMLGGVRRTLVHLFGVVSGIPSSAPRFVVQPDSTEARDVRERRIANFLVNQQASSTRASDSTARASVPPMQWVGTLLAVDEDDHAERTLIDSDGKYSLPDLHTGKWELVVNVASCQPLRMNVELRADEPERRIDIRLEPKKSIQVHLIVHPAKQIAPPANSGMPDAWLEPSSRRTVSEVSIVASREPPGKVLEAMNLGMTPPIDVMLLIPADDFTESVPSGARADQTRTLLIAEPLPLHVSVVAHGVVLETKRADVDTEEMTFELEGDRLLESMARARLRVVDAESGEVPADCTITLEAQTIWGGYHLSRGSSSGVPDPRGDVEFSSVTSGPMTLKIRADGYEAIAQNVQVVPGDNDLGTFKLDRWCVILGHTLDAGKHPVSVIVNVFPLDQFERTRVELSKRCFKSNEDGELKIPSIGRGRYLLRVHDDTWGTAPLVVDTTGGTVRGVEIVVKPKIEVALRFDRTLPAYALLRLTDGSGLPVLESERTSGHLQRIRALPGIYTLRVTSGNEELLQSALFVDSKPSEVAIPGGR